MTENIATPGDTFADPADMTPLAIAWRGEVEWAQSHGFSTLDLILSGRLASDDAVDIDLWLGLRNCNEVQFDMREL